MTLRKRSVRKQLSYEPRRRSDVVRLSEEAARRVRDGHPWVFEEALKGRTLSVPVGSEVTLIDEQSNFIARAVLDTGGPIVLRVFSRVPDARLLPESVAATVRRAVARRQQFGMGDPLSCFRVINGDSEGFPTINVDYYNGFLLISAYSGPIWERVQTMVEALVSAYRPIGIYLQRRFSRPQPGVPRPAAELIWGEAAPATHFVCEGKLRFNVDVTSPTGTGLFPDMRLGRHAVSELAAGRSVINCFSYGGAFSVVAAAHGAKSVTSVDSASRAHALARINFSLNRLDPDDSRFEFATADTFAFLSQMEQRNKRYDMVILDPPSYSSAKGRTFTTQQDYAELVAASLDVLEHNGVLCAASNTAKLPSYDFERVLGRGAAMAGRSLLVTSKIGQPADFLFSTGFNEGAYLKFVVAVVE